MSNTDNTSLGDRMKEYEKESTKRYVNKEQHLVVRLDGSSFHKFTKGMKQPFDAEMSALMRETTRALVSRYSATVGYTQSDEITLIWNPRKEDREFEFGGRVQKLESEIAAWCSVYFNQILLLSEHADRHKLMPYFDARAFNVPSENEAFNCLLWRQLDCSKNSISMAAQSEFSPKELHQKHSGEKILMLHQNGIDYNQYPEFFRLGTFVVRRKTFTEMSIEQLNNIPEQFRPKGPIERNVIEMHSFNLADPMNRVDSLRHIFGY